jgi:hypothetical protein
MDTSDRRQSEVNGGGCVGLLFEKDPVPQNYGAVECQSRLSAVPLDKVSDGAIVATLAAFGREAVQDGCFGLFEVGKRQDSLRRSLLLTWFGHGRRPP